MASMGGIPDHVTSNIEAVAALRSNAERALPRGQKTVERLTQAIGRPLTLYCLALVVCCWCAFNLEARASLRFDPPPFFWLQGAIALYAAFMTTTILATQNRQNREAEQRAHLELQVNLLAEQRTAKIIALLEELRRDLPNVKDRIDPVAEAMQEAVAPLAVVSALEETMGSSPPPDSDSEQPSGEE